METKTKFALGFVIVGFAIGMMLRGYAFYITSHGRSSNLALFLILCPPSIGAMAEGAGLLGRIIGWIFISVENAGLYALLGLAPSRLVRDTRN